MRLGEASQIETSGPHGFASAGAVSSMILVLAGGSILSVA
jgi:hypothetical protein